MKKTVTRRQVLTALRTEPLKNGDWVHDKAYDYDANKDGTCSVCAVGAIVRAAGYKDFQVSERANSACHGAAIPFNEKAPPSEILTEAHHMAKDGDYFGSLSFLYEGMAERLGPNGKRIRTLLAKHVKTYFPKTLKI